MSSQIKPVSLTRRIVGHYLVFGLLCLLLCLAATLVLSMRGNFELLVPLAACVPFIVLAVGAFTVIQTVRLNSEVEEQLQRISTQSPESQLQIQQLSGSDPVASGWNTLIERLTTHDAWSRLEDRLAKAVCNVEQCRVEQAFRQLPLAAAGTNSNGDILLLNQAFLSLVECDEESQVLGRSILEVLNAHKAENAEEIGIKLNGYQGTVSIDLHRGAQIQDGVLRLSRSQMPTAEDSSIDIWMVRDVTQQLLAEDSRNQFVFTATHELRTPLGNIKSYAELLELDQDIDVEKQKEFCNIIVEESDRLLHFVDELLNISQMEAGSMSIYRHETNMEDLVADVVRHVRPEMDKKQISFETKFPNKWPKLELDKEKIESALVNLLGNAAKYTPDEGNITFEVKVDSEHVCLQVEDTGIGIAEEELKHVFDKFFRSDDERVRSISGNGLGLAFTQEVARMHGGQLTVHSELNKGSRFTLTLPPEKN